MYEWAEVEGGSRESGGEANGERLPRSPAVLDNGCAGVEGVLNLQRVVGKAVDN